MTYRDYETDRYVPLGSVAQMLKARIDFLADLTHRALNTLHQNGCLHTTYS